MSKEVREIKQRLAWISLCQQMGDAMNPTGISGTAGIPGRAVGARFLARWILYSVIAGLVALAVAAETPPWAVGVIPSGDEANTDGWRVGWAVVMAGLLAGAALGGIQWLLLRRWFSGGRPWIMASAIGFALSFTVAWAVSGGVFGADYAHHGLPHAVDRAQTWGGALIGAVLGAAQSLVLRAQGSTAAWWWVPASTLGMAVGWWVAAAMSEPVYAALGPLTHFWGGAVFGVVFGAITGGALAWLSRRQAFAEQPS